MKEYKIENLELLNEKGGVYFGKEKIFSRESASEQEKIDFIDSHYDGIMTYLLQLKEKFDKDKETLPKDNFGDVKTVSLKSWIKRNDNRDILDNIYKYGKIRKLNLDINIYSDWNDLSGFYFTYGNIVDEVFHRLLKELKLKEKKWFEEHDEYSILKKKYREYEDRYRISFDVPIITSSNGSIKVAKNNDTFEGREITIEELKLLIGKYEELENHIEKISNEINIKY